MTTPFTNPILFDKIAQEINTALAQVTSTNFDTKYPVCWTRTEGEETVPEVYQNDGTKVNLRVMPDATSSLSFFTIEGELVEVDEMDLECPMAITVWVNLQEHDLAKAYDYTAELVRDVSNVLKAYGCYNLSINLNTPFEGFSMLDKEVNANIMRPYSAFKITFAKTARICEP